MGETAAGAVCLICGTEVGAEGERVPCPACAAPYHTDCWAENQGCARYGCTQVPVTQPRSPLEFAPAYWGQEHKPCPACSKEILAAAVRCRHCGIQFASARPVSSQEFSKQSAAIGRRGWMHGVIVLTAVACLIPFTAPLGVLVGGGWAAAQGKRLAACSSFHQTLLKIGLGVGALQTLMILAISGIYTIFYSHRS